MEEWNTFAQGCGAVFLTCVEDFCKKMRYSMYPAQNIMLYLGTAMGVVLMSSERQEFKETAVVLSLF